MSGVGEGTGDGVGDGVGYDVGDDVGDNVGDGIGLRRIAPLGFRRLLITGIRNYKLKLPLQTYFDRQPPETLGTYSPGDPLPFGPSSKFRRCSYATAHAGENRMSIIGTLR